jgi:hypothetical protein
MIREFIFSCPLFGGFRCFLNVTSHSTLTDLVRQCVEQLTLMLAYNRLEMLLSQLKTKKYHIHDDMSIETIMTSDAVIYVCDCLSFQ